MKAAAVAATVAFGLASAVPSNLQDRDVIQTCTARSHNGPLITNPDTVEAFKRYTEFTSQSFAAAIRPNVPEGYKYVEGFVTLGAAAQHPSYLASIEPEAYKPDQCAEACDLMEGCVSFNICKDPPATTMQRN